MRLLLLGSFDFEGPLKRLGLEVYTCGSAADADLRVADHDPDWLAIQKTAAGLGLSFDAVLVCDNVGNRSLPLGLTGCPAVTAFFGVDAPLNDFWQQPYSQLFDIALFDQPEQARSANHDNAHWLPLGVNPSLYRGPAPANPDHGVAFVGVVNPIVRPKRSAILDRVRRLAPLEIRGGRKGQWFSSSDAAKLYRQYKAVLNENLFPGFTTRPLEVMASGGMLISEGPYKAMEHHFTELEHLLYYNPENLDQRLELALSDSELRKRLIKKGQQAILDSHTLNHRAETVVEHLRKAMDAPRHRPEAAEALLLEGKALMWAALRWPAKDGKRRLLRAAGRLRQATETEHTFISDAAIAGIVLGRGDQAMSLLSRAAEQGGQLQSLQLATTAAMMGHGDIFRRVADQWNNGLSGLAKGPGTAEFHLAAAKLLLREGLDLTPGFNRGKLPIQTWNAFEHLIEATRLDPGSVHAWELAGDILLKRGAPNEAHVMFARACALRASRELDHKLAQAAREGYLC